MSQVTEEEMQVWRKERATYQALMVEGFPSMFGLVFNDEVGMAGSVASSMNCAFDYVARCKPIKDLSSHISFTKTPHNPNSNTPSLLPEFIKFTHKIANSEGKDTFDFALVGCLAILATYAEDPDCLAVIRDFSGNLGQERFSGGTLSYSKGCAREAWIHVLGRFFDRSLSSMSYYGLDEAGRTNITRELAHRLWEQDGKPEGKEQQHWKEAESKVSGLLSLIELGLLDTVLLDLKEESSESYQRYHRVNRK